MTKLEIVNEMIKKGYNLMGTTAEEMAERFDKETLEMFLESFLKWKKG